MKFALFIHNDDVKCFHMVVQGTHKLVMMGHVNFKDHALIKRQRANEKMNLTGGMLKDEKNMIIVESKLRLLLEVVCVFEVLEFITI
jgi:hypothetical protein